MKAVEDELENAIYKAGGISESNYGFLQKVFLIDKYVSDKKKN